MKAHRPNPETDPFRPPDIPTEVFCLHCRQEYESYLMEWREEAFEGRLDGAWCCATEGCSGRGFGFDIFPTDPDYRGPDGQPMWEDDELDDEEDEGDDLFAEPWEDAGPALDELFEERDAFDTPPPIHPGDDWWRGSEDDDRRR
ncbi:MAG: hypothetical protein WD009_02660 [Phycisphaeraceae bacterium]